MSKKLFSILSLLVIASMVLAACGTTAPPEIVKQTELVTVKETEVVTVKETSVVKETEVVVVTATPEPGMTYNPLEMAACVAGTGAMVESVVFTGIDQAEAAMAQLQAGEIDIYAYSVNDPAIFETVQSDANLAYSTAFGSFNELTFNPVGPEFTDGRLNPFSVPAIREAMNMLMDRNYIAQEIYGGLAVPKFTILNSSFADYARYIDTTRKIEAAYSYNLDKAKELIDAEMTKLGATLVDGKWNYNGAPVTIILLIRTEDERKEIGDYAANQLEAVGFTADRQYKTRSEASPIWVQGNPADGLFHIYTGGWITTAISRDDGSNFSFYYTPRDYPIPLWQAYTPDPAFDEIALKLRNNDFTTMEERGELFKQALEMAMKDSVRIFLVDQISFSPQTANMAVSYDLAGGVAAADLWPFTIDLLDTDGGTVRWAQPGVLVDPWNPVGGSNWVYDSTPINATRDEGLKSDPYTGLSWPQRIESAAVTVQTGLPVAKTLDWVSLEFADTIEVPMDAWADWDPIAQKFITVEEKFGEPQVAKVKSVVTYPADLWTTVKWHDGSPISMGDFVMSMIMTFDPGLPGSQIYDAAAAESLAAFMDHFKGVRIVSTDPLVIETYDDLYALDAENIPTTWFPTYTYGPGAWHNIALGVNAEAGRKLAFTADKAEKLQVEWASYIAGPSLEVLKAELDAATVANSYPYSATMGLYVTPEEISARWANLQSFYAARGHFWLGTGPFYLEGVFPVEGTLTVKCNGLFTDPSDKWSGFGTPKIGVVDLEGPAEVAAGSEATFDVLVTFEDAPYLSTEVAGVKYLLFDATGTLVASGDATFVEEGKYQVVLGTDVTALLTSGSNKLEVAFTSLVVSVPTLVSVEFVTP